MAKILIVDDDEQFVREIAQELTIAGHRCFVELRGDRAVEKSSKQVRALITVARDKPTRPHPARLRLATLSRRARETTSSLSHLAG